MANPSKSVISGFTMKMGFVQKLGIPKTIIMSRFRFIPFFFGPTQVPDFLGSQIYSAGCLVTGFAGLQGWCSIHFGRNGRD
jgi:hypothetical protein